MATEGEMGCNKSLYSLRIILSILHEQTFK